MPELDREKVVVVGPGAMGCLFAGLLAAAGAPVRLLDRRPERARLLSGQGIVIERGGRRQTYPVPVSADPGAIGPAGLVIVCVKAYDTAAAAEFARPLVGQATEVLSLQNGLGNVEALTAAFGPDRVLGGTTAQGAFVLAPGVVRHAGVGETVIGEPRGGRDRAERVAAWLTRAGVPATVTDDLEALVWSKLVINVAINPLTALLGLPNGALPELAPARELMRAVVDEVEAVCARRGTRLLHPDPLEKALAVARATGDNVSSMLADVRNQRRTEIDQLRGAGAREAAALGLAATANLTLARLVRAREESYLPNERGPAISPEGKM
jgi:2-dehydropantoate 2-reductase